MEEKTLVLCCGGKKCPSATKHADGSVVICDATDGREDMVRLTREQFDLLVRFVRGDAR